LGVCDAAAEGKGLARTIAFQHPNFRDVTGAMFYDQGGYGDKLQTVATGAGKDAAADLRARVAPAGSAAGRRYLRGRLPVPGGGSFRWLINPPPR
jgi:hypothetical protein